MFKIYTDWACSGNPGPGWRWVVALQNWNDQNKITKLSGKKKHTTNNEMELTAVIEWLKRAREQVQDTNMQIEVYLDSQYVKQWIEERIITWRKNNRKNYRKKTIAHVALRQELDLLVWQLSVTRHWVKWHNWDKYNEMADKLAWS